MTFCNANFNLIVIHLIYLECMKKLKTAVRIFLKMPLMWNTKIYHERKLKIKVMNHIYLKVNVDRLFVQKSIVYTSLLSQLLHDKNIFCLFRKIYLDKVFMFIIACMSKFSPFMLYFYPKSKLIFMNFKYMNSYSTFLSNKAASAKLQMNHLFANHL